MVCFSSVSSKNVKVQTAFAKIFKIPVKYAATKRPTKLSTEPIARPSVENVTVAMNPADANKRAGTSNTATMFIIIRKPMMSIKIAIKKVCCQLRITSFELRPIARNTDFLSSTIKKSAYVKSKVKIIPMTIAIIKTGRRVHVASGPRFRSTKAASVQIEIIEKLFINK